MLAFRSESPPSWVCSMSRVVKRSTSQAVNSPLSGRSRGRGESRRFILPQLSQPVEKPPGKLYGLGVGFATMLFASAALADGPDISAQHLLSSWQDEDPGMKMVAEVIASAFASGFSWGGDAAGKGVYCASPDLKGPQIMSAFEVFVRDNPEMADEPYGAAMAGALRKAFPCGTQ
jgi:hypothetical protein